MERVKRVCFLKNQQCGPALIRISAAPAIALAVLALVTLAGHGLRCKINSLR